MNMTRYALAAILAAAPVAASAQVAVADLNNAVRQSAAFQGATAQIRTTYKTQIDQITARQTALNGELQPLITAYQQAAQRPGATEASVKPQFDAVQTKRQAIERELQPLAQPIARAQAYVEEQIVAKLDQATRQAMTKRQIKTLLRPEATVAVDPTADLTTAISTELNTLIPTASITPPANWQPGQTNRPAQPAQQQPQQPQQQPQSR